MWTVIFNALTVLSLLASLVATWLGVRNAVAALELRHRFESFKTLDAQSLEQRLSEYESTLSLLANRLKMTKVRNAVTHVDRDKGGEPDPRLDPEAWRAWKNAQLRAGQYNQ